MATVGIKGLNSLVASYHYKVLFCSSYVKFFINYLIIIIIIIIIHEKINVAFSPKTTRTRNIQKKRKNDVFGR